MMNNQSAPFEFTVQRCGATVWPLFQGQGDGRVVAVFDSSFYVEIDGHYACIGTEALDAAPLNLTTSAPGATDWRASGLCINAKVGVSDHTIRVGRRFHFRLTNTARWSPEPLPADWNRERIAHGISEFRRAAEGRIPDEGLGLYINEGTAPRENQIVATVAKVPIAGLCEWLTNSFHSPNSKITKGLRWVYPLTGTGPGLTPSGGDFIGGMMITLRALGETEICHRLWIPTKRCALEIDNPIATAHLEAAFEGLANSGVHRMLNAIMAGLGEEIQDAVNDIDGIGHTSGWDAMAGIIAVLEVWLETHLPVPKT